MQNSPLQQQPANSPLLHCGSASTGLRDRLRRAACLQHLLETYQSDEDDKPHDAPIWENWLRQSGELPPEFDDLPTNAFLPNVLQFNDGRLVTSPEEWRLRTQEVLAILEQYQLGVCPPPPPDLVVEELAEAVDEERNGRIKQLRLIYGPSAKAIRADTLVPYKDPAMYRTVHLHVELFIPNGNGPFPAVVEVGSRRGDRITGSLSARAAQRGYVVCTFDRNDAFRAKDVYTDYQYVELGWWAFGASRCIDYLLSVDVVNHEKIAVIGHSRGGKMALITAALDGRVAAVIASHNGAGAGTTPPWRYLGEKYGGETLESSTLSFPYWNHPRLRFFAGRENKLPFDSHFLMALVAPRAFLITEGDADDVSEPWATQQAYLATQEVYTLLGHPERLNIAFHPGGHRLAEEVFDQYIDWLDMQLGEDRPNFPNQLMYTYTFEKWRELTGENIDPATFPEQDLDQLLVAGDGSVGDQGSLIQSPEMWQNKRDGIRKNILWALGELPPQTRQANATLTHVQSIPAALTSSTLTSSALIKAKLPVEGKLVGHLTYPAQANEKLPVVIYLHAYLDICGHAWSAEYGWAVSVGERLAQKGFLAVEYDQFGYGTRNRDSGHEFYQANPRQSVMGVMVQDLRKMIDALCELPMVDPTRIMVAGFSLGGAVALYAAALEERIAAVASTCGFASMRLDRHGQATEGLMRYSHLRPTLPRLGFFVGQEKRVPYDFHEMLAMIAPRPVLVVAPLLDQDFYHEDVRACYTAAATVYKLLGAENKLQLETPNDFNRYPPHYQHLVNDWLYQVAKGCTS